MFSSSAAQLSYGKAQDVIDGRTLGRVAVAPQHEAMDIEHDVKVLNNLAKRMRNRRVNNGTLSLESVKLNFVLDEQRLPTDCSPYDRTEAHEMVEEVIKSLHLFFS